MSEFNYGVQRVYERPNIYVRLLSLVYKFQGDVRSTSC